MIRKSLVALAAVTAASFAQATLVTYNFSGSFDDAPSTTVLTGTFSYDTEEVSNGGGEGAFNLATLTLSFLGKSYTKADAVDPYIAFEGGLLVGPNGLFHLTADAGSVSSSLALQPLFGTSSFTYSVAGSATGPATDHLGTLTVSAVPEPASWALALGGLAAVALRTRRRRA